ncbi:MAG: hypothetical protein DLM72_02745 [Candidatus Nitrosopolaris wilkensis]|nr:MAG: hypothetical protein DLM72_02745 [Candidatus Nitrosopolaris wilkensis]
MILRDDNHLHIDNQDPIADWLVRSMRRARTGSIKLDIEGQPAVKIDIINNGNKIMVDLLQPVFFRTPEDETGLFDKLKTVKEFARKLTDNGMTISFLRRGKEAVTIGRDAKPTLSKIITKSDDVQINSVTQTSNLKRDLKAD